MTFSKFIFSGLLGTLALSSCADEGSTLYVALVTDIVPGVEFTTLRVELDDRQQMRGVLIGDDFVQGIRVAEFADLTPGEHSGRVVLEDRTGDRVVARPFSVEIRAGQQTGTIVIARECFGVMCPGAGDPSATACLAGRCVDPRCSPETPQFCPFADCFGDDECAPAAACAEATCVSGVCLYAEAEGACGALSYCDPDRGCEALPGGMDAGVVDASVRDTGARDVGPQDAALDIPMDAGCECAVGTTDIVACGRGCTTGERMCGADCRWQAPICEEVVGPSSCWLWVSRGATWNSYPEPTSGTNEPTSAVVAAFDVEAVGEAYLLTSTTFHVLRLSDRAWVASGPLPTLFPDLDGPPTHAFSIPATYSPRGRERVEVITTGGMRFVFDHQTGTRRWTAVGEPMLCCDAAGWEGPSAPPFDDIQAAWFDTTNTRGLYNDIADPLCPAAMGYSGDIAFATFLSREGRMLYQLELQNCSEFTPPWDAEDDEPFGGVRFGGSGPDPRPEATRAAFYHESDSAIWVITP